MKVASLLVEIRRLMPTLPPAHVDPLRAIFERCKDFCAVAPSGKRWNALQGSVADTDEREVGNLPPEVLGLLDALG